MAIRIIPARRVRKVKTKNGQEVLQRLEEYLENESNDPVEILCGFWKDQQDAITYQELRQAVLEGTLTTKALELWRQDYSILIANRLNNMWVKAIEAGPAGQPILDGLAFEFNTQTPGLLKWINERGAQLVTACTQEQKDAIAALLTKKMREQYTVDELSRLIRPCIGLTKGDTQAAVKLYNSIIENLKKEHPRMKPESMQKKALDATCKYAERKHRQRAMTIARTESAFAYNRGADTGVRQAQEQGYLGTVKKRWSTSGDDKVCSICQALEGMEIEMDKGFPFKGRMLFPGQDLLPPAHPNCACAVEYIEVSQPIIVKPEELMQITQESEPIGFDTPEDAEAYFGQHPDRTLRRENREEYDRQIDAYNQSMYKSWENGLEMAESRAIKNYAGPDFSGINGLLRHKMTENMVTIWNESTNMNVQDMIENITSAISKFDLKDNIKVYRTCKNDVLQNLQTKVGSVFHDNGFGSTTVVREKKASGNIFMEIEVPKGKGVGAWISPIGQPDEYEFLLQRGTDYIVEGVDYVEENTIIRMKVTGRTATEWSYATKEEVIEQWKQKGIYDEADPILNKL